MLPHVRTKASSEKNVLEINVLPCMHDISINQTGTKNLPFNQDDLIPLIPENKHIRWVEREPCIALNLLHKQAWKSAYGSCRHGSFRLLSLGLVEEPEMVHLRTFLINVLSGSHFSWLVLRSRAKVLGFVVEGLV